MKGGEHFIYVFIFHYFKQMHMWVDSVVTVTPVLYLPWFESHFRIVYSKV